MLHYEASLTKTPEELFQCTVLSDSKDDLYLNLDDSKFEENEEKIDEIDSFADDIFQIISENVHEKVDWLMQQIQNVEIQDQDPLAEYKKKIKQEYLERVADVQNCILTVTDYKQEKMNQSAYKELQKYIFSIQWSKEFINLSFCFQMFSLGSLNSFFTDLEKELTFKKQTKESLEKIIEELLFLKRVLFSCKEKESGESDIMSFGSLQVILSAFKNLMTEHFDKLLDFNQKIHADTNRIN